MVHEPVGGRLFGEIYKVSGRSDLHGFLIDAVEESGGRVLYASESNRAPVYLGVQLNSDERIGILIYPFRMTRKSIKNRPGDEVRGQLRYGSEDSWEREHKLGRDIAGVDVTLIVGIDLDDGVMIGLDASLWDPLPMGISFYAKYSDILTIKAAGWHAWEKINRAGTKRLEARSPTNLETVVGFTPSRLLDYARLERQASSLGLDPPLRYTAAINMAAFRHAQHFSKLHTLESQFSLDSQQILDIISSRIRLSVAVRGGVAEHHLERQLNELPEVHSVIRLDQDAMHDFDVTLHDGSVMRIECKNASPKVSLNGDFKVEVQKTRASKGDPASRFYPVDAFDVVAACLFSATGIWEFRFNQTSSMPTHTTFPDRLKPVQAVTASWTVDLASLKLQPRAALREVQEHAAPQSSGA